MRTWALAIVVAALSEVGRAIAAPSSGDGAGCKALEVDVARDLEGAWIEAGLALPRQLADALTADECSNVRIHVARSEEAPAADVSVRMPDGRETSRRARGPASLFSVVLGLLASAPPSRPSAAAPVATDPHELPDLTPSSPAPRPSEGADHVGLSIGFGVGSRVGLPTHVVMADAELFAQVVVRDWIVSGSVRYAPIAWAKGLTPDGDAYEEADIGLGIGRRFHAGSATIDATFMPMLALVSMETDLPLEVSGTAADLRFNGCLRYGAVVGPTWRFSVALDSEIAPNALVHAQVPAPGLVPVPGWTAGLRLGFAAKIL